MTFFAGMRGATKLVGRRSPGFSLVELVVALAVMSVAVAIFVKLFGGTLDLARQGRNHDIAASIAESQLNTLVHHPNRFRWEREDDTLEKPFPIRLAEDDPRAGNPFQPPEALPAEIGLDERMRALYDNFRWKAFGRVPPGQPYAEVSVVVSWEESGRERRLALTSAVPLAAVSAWVAPVPDAPEEEEAAPAAEEEAAA